MDQLWSFLFPSAFAADGQPTPQPQASEPSSSPLQLTVRPNDATGGQPGFSSPMGLENAGNQDIGTSLEPQGQGAGPGGMGERLLKALQGVKVPAPPEAQKVATPHGPPAPRTQIQGGELLALLQHAGMVNRPPTPQMPTTLGAAIGR